MKTLPERQKFKVAIVKHFGTQDRLAKEAGIDKSRISRIVRNKVSPTPDQETKLSKMLKMSAKKLFEVEKN